jgi:hypothetical protein
VSVRTEQILEESYPVAAHRRRASRQTGPRSPAHNENLPLQLRLCLD